MQWHALNFVRNILGQKLGFRAESNHYDPYAGHSDRTLAKHLQNGCF